MENNLERHQSASRPKEDAKPKDSVVVSKGDSKTNPFEERGNDEDQGVDQGQQNKYSQDPLQGIGGPMTRARTNKMKEVLQGLIMEMHDKEVVLEVSNATPRIITYLYVQDNGQGLELAE
ncbi:uncharacterized protein LOC123194381 [Mangifera indica]|uniref:uncharacterized protein LOC123194381 n=1 Tax=Mangifera indica TaxID=29780 RepID=UPI001CF9CDB6|nr:uncharacterized protein LOC123194381 [Mangifera indica]